MNDEFTTEEKTIEPKMKKNILYRFDRLIARLVPNGNIRAVLYLSLIFVVVLCMQFWRIATPPAPAQQVDNTKGKETVIADNNYWDSSEYKDKLSKQTVTSFVEEFKQWVDGTSQEFSRRKFEDMVYINAGLSQGIGDLTSIVPESFNYLENNGKARYQYTKDKGFLSDTPTLVKLGTLTCEVDEKTEQVTDIELYDWRYTSMQKLAAFMKTNPDWKIKVGSRIFDISDPRIEDKDVLALNNTQTQPSGLFSFLIFHNVKTNRIVVADSTILEKNGVDMKLTLSNIDFNKMGKEQKVFFQSGYESCKSMNSIPTINYGQSD